MKTLKSAVLRQLGGGAEARQNLQDVANHGADSGFPGFSYYSETRIFTSRNKKQIVERLNNLAAAIGETPAQCLSGFRCLGGVGRDTCAAYLAGGRVDEKDKTQIENSLAWFALEEVANETTEDKKNENN